MADIGEAFGGDHQRLERLLEASAAHVRAGQWDAALASFSEFRRGIQQHMDIEEQELFPAVEGGAQTPLTATLRKGHRDLRAFFDELDDALEARDAEEVGRINRTVRALLTRHDEMEERDLYPAAQARLGEFAGERSVHRLQVQARRGPDV
jgi:hemerythrin-like domain-containing protein